jgi:hypothetical protein
MRCAIPARKHTRRSRQFAHEATNYRESTWGALLFEPSEDRDIDESAPLAGVDPMNRTCQRPSSRSIRFVEPREEREVGCDGQQLQVPDPGRISHGPSRMYSPRHELAIHTSCRPPAPPSVVPALHTRCRLRSSYCLLDLSSSVTSWIEAKILAKTRRSRSNCQTRHAADHTGSGDPVRPSQIAGSTVGK